MEKGISPSPGAINFRNRVENSWAKSSCGFATTFGSKEIMKENRENPLNLKSLNHISLLCRSVDESLDFYKNVLGFSQIKRPNSFNFDGAWYHFYIYSQMLAIYILCENMGAVEKKLKEMDIDYLKSRVEEGGIYVDQLFFHDPNGSMIEICNCDNLPVVPLSGDTVRSCSHKCAAGMNSSL
ncbi:hypothetical protein RHSIM_Rhsim03G0241800 [Rhododendron simsii]|uniref:VOC domain-containing protein n=1 Tax=Rhododendron simsii TaxID=118357 RepID=A0A834H5Y2_RHOSS|nr:hypothetical protein RHSIM_Rhsim03G0241800 [Rhododendron simsii]